MPNNPTLAEQRRAGLVTRLSVAALCCLGYRVPAEPPDLPPPPPPPKKLRKKRQPRTLPPGVYLEGSGRLVAKFVRHVNGERICVIVTRGEYFDQEPKTVARLAQACKEAAAAWDARRNDPER